MSQGFFFKLLIGWHYKPNKYKWSSFYFMNEWMFIMPQWGNCSVPAGNIEEEINEIKSFRELFCATYWTFYQLCEYIPIYSHTINFINMSARFSPLFYFWTLVLQNNAEFKYLVCYFVVSVCRNYIPLICGGLAIPDVYIYLFCQLLEFLSRMLTFLLHRHRESWISNYKYSTFWKTPFRCLCNGETRGEG